VAEGRLSKDVLRNQEPIDSTSLQSKKINIEPKHIGE
jgi:hypothetical protein